MQGAAEANGMCLSSEADTRADIEPHSDAQKASPGRLGVAVLHGWT
jgi:hypothetical protein